MSKDLLKIAITAALEASKEILKIYIADNFVVELKADDSPLTKADLLSNQIIKHYLKKLIFQYLKKNKIYRIILESNGPNWMVIN